MDDDFQSIPCEIEKGIVRIPSFTVASPIETCPDCGREMAIVPIDDDRGMAYDECECGTQSEPYVIYEDALSATLVLDDILDAEFLE